MKNRDNIYLCVRLNSDGRISVCSAHPTHQIADQVASGHNQAWEDRGWGEYAKFEVWVTSFYE